MVEVGASIKELSLITSNSRFNLEADLIELINFCPTLPSPLRDFQKTIC